MRNKVWVGIFLIVMVIGIGAFGYLSYSKSELPDFIILGNPAELGPLEKSSLPTGYRWVPEKFPQISINTFDARDEKAYFVIDPKYNNMEEIVEWSKTSGKREIYISFQEPIDPDQIIHGGVTDTVYDIYEILFPKITTKLLDVFSVTEALGHGIPDPSCTTGYFIPAGGSALITCLNYWQIPQDKTTCENNCPVSGNTPSFRGIVNYPTYSCHAEPMIDHIWRNVDYYPVEKRLYGGNHPPNQTPVSTTYCMGNSHNPGQHYCQPSELTINLYDGRNSGFPCASNADGCATGGPGGGVVVDFNAPVLTNKGQSIWILEGKFRQNIWLLRHEFQHTYGFFHGPNPGNCSSMNPSGHDTFHCCDKHRYN